MYATIDFLDENVTEGDDIPITWTLTSSGSPFDLSTVTKVWITVKKDYDDDDSAALIAINSDDDPTLVQYGVAGPGAGKIYGKLIAASTVGLAQYRYVYYDIQGLNASNIQTFVHGRIKFHKQATKYTS